MRGMRLLCLLGMLAFLSPAFSQETPRSDAETLKLLEQRQAANASWRALFDKGKYKEALAPSQRTLELDQQLFGNEHSETASSHNNVAVVLFELGDYKGSRKHYEQAAEIYVKALGENHNDTARAYNNLGILCHELNDDQAARQYYERALAIRRKALGDSHPETAESYDKLGLLLMELSQYSQARSYQEKALAIRKKAYGENHVNTVPSYHNLGKLEADLGNYAAAVKYLQKAYDIYRQERGEEHPLTAESLMAISTLNATMGDFAGARRDYERALAIYRRALGGEHLALVTVYNNYGALLQTLGDYPAAMKMHAQALAISRKVLGENARDTGTSYNNLGVVAAVTGDYALARRYYETALAIKRRAFGEDHEDVADGYGNLGSLASQQGDYATARDHYERELAILRRVLGDESPATAVGYQSLASIHNQLGNYAACRENLTKALAIRRQVFGDNHHLTATDYDSLGTLQARTKDYAGARESYEKALAIRKEIFGPQHPSVADSYVSLGNLEQEQGNYAAALKFEQQAAEIFQKHFGDEHLKTAGAWCNIALAQMALGDFEDARKNNLRFVEFVRKTFGDAHETTIGAYENFASIETLQQHWPAAAKWIDQERRLARQVAISQLPQLSEQEQLLFLEAKFRKRTSTALSLALLQHDDPKIVGLAAGWLLNSKGMAQEALTQRALLAREARDPKLAPLVAELQSVRGQLAKLSLVQAATPAAAAARQKQLSELAAREAALARQLAQGGAATVAPAWVELAVVRQALQSDERLIEIAYFDRWKLDELTQKPEEARYLAVVIGPDATAPQLLDLGPAEELDKLVKEWRTSIAKAEEVDREQAAKMKARLTDRLWKPLAPHLSGVKRLYLSPDGALWLAPWAALPIERDRVLLEELTLSYLVSGRDLLATPSSIKPNVPTLFADPDYDLAPQQTAEAAKAVLRAAYKPDSSLIAGHSQLGRAARLPGTAVEAKLIAPSVATFAGMQPVVYTERYALESVAKFVQRPRLTVFSTHGFFLPDQAAKADASAASFAAQGRRSTPLSTDGQPIQNPLLRCGLLFAGCNPRNRGEAGTGEDGVLTGMEIVGIDYRGTELVVLSACESGVGSVNTGEGVSGLRQAFQLAGAQAVVATLWQIPDRDSALIMNDFFANLAAGQSKAEALRSAQRKRIAERQEKYGAASPFYWAAWTVTGK